jgi:twitching motility protein PilT
LQPPREPEINKLFRVVRSCEAYVLQLMVGEPPMIRLRGELRRMDISPLTQVDMQRLLFPIMDDQQRQSLDETGQAFFAHVVGKDEGGFACTVSQKDGQLRMSACLLEGASEQKR